MDKLTKAYKSDTLTPNELQTLKEKINKMSDDELTSVIYDDWNQENLQTCTVDNMRMARIKNAIEAKINGEKPSYPFMHRIIQIAAAILLPIFIISTFYLYKENNQILSDETIVTTGKGERASIILPDGTEVALNYDSKISYTPKSYNKEREVKFDGEGYFRVSKNKKRPFIIYTKGLQINVLGTTFNLSARSSNATAELALEEGSVQLISVTTGESVLLGRDQKAILDYKTKHITVINSDEISKAASWRKGDLIFRNEKLKVVLQTLEDNYNYKISVDSDEHLEDIFTGTLPISDINETLEVLEKLYHYKAIIKDKEIFLRKEH